MDFLDRLIDYIEGRVATTGFIEVGKLSSKSESVAVRPTPSGMSSRYTDGGNVRDYSFQVLVKDSNQFKAIQKIERINQVLDGMENKDIVSNNDSFEFIKCEVYTLPNYVEETDDRKYIYTAMYVAELQGGQ